jgi:transcription initiation factor TFIIIB Brf1 subunit/transcription initiation factor TFIIB
VKGRQAVAMHAACVYMACRLEHNPRTFKEILAGAPGTSKARNTCQLSLNLAGMR